MGTTTPQAQGSTATPAATAPTSAPVAPSRASSTPLPAWAQHSNPAVAKALAAVARGHGAHYPSAAALCNALGVHGKANQRQVRQVLRNAGMGVGRGRTYNGPVGRKLAQAGRKVHAQQAKAAKAAAKAPAKAAKG